EGNRCLLCGRRRPDRCAHGKIDPVHFGCLRLPGREHAFGIMRLDPALQEARRHRKPHAFVLYAFQIHAREPACVDVLAYTRAQTAFDARPTILFRICHCEKLFKVSKGTFVDRRCRFPANGATSGGLAPDKARPFGGTPRVRPVMSGAEDFPRGQRVLGLSATRVGGRMLGRTASSKWVWLENGNWPNTVASP